MGHEVGWQEKCITFIDLFHLASSFIVFGFARKPSHFAEVVQQNLVNQYIKRFKIYIFPSFLLPFFWGGGWGVQGRGAAES